MRKATKVAAAIFGLGSVAIGYQVGTAAEVSSNFASGSTSAAQPTDTVTSDPATSTSTATDTGTVVSPGSQSSEAVAPQPSASASSKPVASASPSASQSSSSSNTSSGSTKKQTSSAIPYRFGTIQVTVVKTGSKITDITLDIAGATGGRQQAFPYLVNYAIQANGTNFGNLSGATYTTDTFKQAVAEALAKF